MRKTIRELKRLHNFSSQTTEDVVDKATIINRVLFGNDERKWKNPEELLAFLDGIADGVDDDKTARAISQLVDVLNYLTGKGDRPDSLAVYEPAEIVSGLVGGSGEPIDYVKFVKDTIIDPLLSEGKFLKKDTKSKFEETMKVLPFSQGDIKQTIKEYPEEVADALSRYQVKNPNSLSDKDKFYWLCWAELRAKFKAFYEEQNQPKQSQDDEPFVRSHGGYRDEGAWSNRANDALLSGLRPAEMIAKELGVSKEAYEDVMERSEWHHVGGSFDKVNFYNPDEAPYCLHAKDIKDKSDVEDYFKICKMREIDLPDYKMADTIKGLTNTDPEEWQKAHKEYYDKFHTQRQNLPSQKLVEEFENMLDGDSWDLEEAKHLAEQIEDQQNKEKKAMEKSYKDFFSNPINKKYYKPNRKAQATRVKSLRY